MTELFDIIANLITEEPFAIGAAILFPVILAVCYYLATCDIGPKFTVLGEDEILVIFVFPFNGKTGFYCSDGNSYYVPIGSNIQEGDIIHKDDLIKFKQIKP